MKPAKAQAAPKAAAKSPTAPAKAAAPAAASTGGTVCISGKLASGKKKFEAGDEAATHDGAANQLSLNDRQVLVGDYPKILDLREYTFVIETFMNSWKEFELAEKEGRPPQPEISISGSECVEVIHFPGDFCDYAVLENLPNLKRLHLHTGRYGCGGPTWLICQNLPSLETIDMDGIEVRWLQLENLTALKSIHLNGCEKLDHFTIKNAPKLRDIELDGCRKLKEILDLSPARKRKLGVTEKIATVQAASKRDLTLYDNMTITDIDMVLANINLGFKLATQMGLGREVEPNVSVSNVQCHQFEFFLLRPFEYVYTGNTGESYCYAFFEFDEDRFGSTLGIHEPEDCLSEALACAAAYLTLPSNLAASDDQILAYLNQLVASQ